MKLVKEFIFKDKVFFISFIIAIISMLFVLPNKKYLDYFNVHVLVTMFCLMISVRGFIESNIFSKIAIYLTSKVFSIRYIVLILVFATYFIGMWVTNDAVLLTLIPFTIYVIKQTNQEKHIVVILVLQTIAANMGSSLTPMGDPQNIYLYQLYQISFHDFILTMLPIAITSLILLIVLTVVLIPNDFVHPILITPKVDKKRVIISLVVFVTVLLFILRIIPVWSLFIVTIILAFVFYPRWISKIDYHLLLTFVAFFIITGNISNLSIMNNLQDVVFTSRIRVYITGILTSQIISNVPATILLSTFLPIQYVKTLLQAVNIGALGTIIASLASLITFRYLNLHFKQESKTYLKTYSLISVIFIIIVTLIIFLF